jgi:PKD domain
MRKAQVVFAIVLGVLAGSCGGKGTPSTPTPTLAVTASPSGVALEQATSVAFSVSGGQSGQMYAWDFGDGSGTSAGATTSHVYSRSGAFAVTVRPANGGDPASVGVTVRSVTGTWDLTVTGDSFLFCTRFSVVLNQVGIGVEGTITPTACNAGFTSLVGRSVRIGGDPRTYPPCGFDLCRVEDPKRVTFGLEHADWHDEDDFYWHSTLGPDLTTLTGSGPYGTTTSGVRR